MDGKPTNQESAFSFQELAAGLISTSAQRPKAKQEVFNRPQ